MGWSWHNYQLTYVIKDNHMIWIVMEKLMSVCESLAAIHCWQVYQWQFDNRLIAMKFEGSKLSYAQFSMTTMVEIIATRCIWLWTSTNSDFSESLKFISLCQQLLWSTHQYANLKISYIDIYPFYQLWVNMRCEVICTQAYTSCKLGLLPLIAINKGCLESWELLIESSHVQRKLMDSYVHKLMTTMCSSKLVIFAKISHSESWREKYFGLSQI
jgi:hypothetical protein